METQQKKPSIVEKRRLLADFFDLPLRDVKTKKDVSVYPFDSAETVVAYVVEHGHWAGKYIVLMGKDMDRVARLCALDQEDSVTPISLDSAEQIADLVCRKTKTDFETQIRRVVPDCPEKQIAQFLTRYREILGDPRLLNTYFNWAHPTCTNNPDYWIVEV